ncbi:thiamine phosphate synthase [Bacillus pinisoli]|uniref:thiamine phosphate synthase n=1 Tax=Bacillus pinisoli TaxID=2901866 RepID=UPI001FF4271B|nr:thiamine phosphate synthase [Bacillus pinisoli]
MNLRESLQLYFVMGSNNCSVDPVYVLEQAILGGVTCFQFREKGEGSLVGEAKVKLAKKLQTVCQQYHVPFIVNDDIELAVAVGADGVHIGQEDEAIDAVRAKMGNMMIGVSCHNLEEARQAIESGADYIGVGPMYPTKTKLDTRNVVGPALIKSLRDAQLSIPMVGIGGIHEANADAVIQAGADGIAVISAISQQENPKLAAENLKRILS